MLEEHLQDQKALSFSPKQYNRNWHTSWRRDDDLREIIFPDAYEMEIGNNKCE